eukprot:6476331-Amphidinium_carterae.1
MPFHVVQQVDILVNALSAMKSPVDLVCVQCPAHVKHRAGYSPRQDGAMSTCVPSPMLSKPSES